MSSRRSARLQQPDNAASVVADNTDDVNDQEDDPQPLKKRRKIAAKPKGNAVQNPPKKVRGRRGLLQELLGAPLDILYEIFGCLEPLDILRLARTSKDLRSLLMHKSSAFVWRQARENVVGLPEPPADLNEPQYANLVFSVHCHNCLSYHSPEIYWSFLIRCCKKCGDESFAEIDEMTTNDSTIKPEVLKKILSLLPSRVTYVRRLRRSVQFYYIPAVDKALEEYKSLKGKEKLKEWVKEKREQKNAINQWSNKCLRWAEVRAYQRSDIIEVTKRRRYEAIIAKLKQLGWDGELAVMKDRIRWQFRRHKMVNQAKDLTERIWTNIKPTFVEWMQDAKVNRLRLEAENSKASRYSLLRTLCTTYQSNQPIDNIMPPVPDIALSEDFRAIIEDTPLTTILTIDDFAPAIAELPRIIQEWRSQKDLELLAILQQHDSNSTLSDLNLATTIFKVSHETCIRYPDILARRSTFSILYDPFRPMGFRGEGTWNERNVIAYDEDASRNVSAVLKACGLDPVVATRDDLETLNPLIECLTCENSVSGCFFARWIMIKNISSHARQTK
ncbi:hypothetical protein C8J56DRAFT_899073 [Mycena floridula]|nr:hypothetical protein C8J56DRAFT_899073 [Mycena floridula]